MLLKGPTHFVCFCICRRSSQRNPSFSLVHHEGRPPRRTAPLRQPSACPLLLLLLRAWCRGCHSATYLHLVSPYPSILPCGSQCLQSGRQSQRNEVHFRGCRFVFVRCRNKGSQCGTIQRSHQDQRPLSQLRVLAKYQRTEAS